MIDQMDNHIKECLKIIKSMDLEHLGFFFDNLLINF